MGQFIAFAECLIIKSAPETFLYLPDDRNLLMLFKNSGDPADS